MIIKPLDGLLLILLLLVVPSWGQHSRPPGTMSPEQQASLNRYRVLAAEQSVEGWYGLAMLYSDRDFPGFQPDSAYFFLQKAQSGWRRLSKGEQRKLERRDIDRPHMARLKAQIKEAALDHAIASGESETINRYLTSYDRLNYELETRAYLERNRLAFAEAVASNTYDSLTAFMERYAESLDLHSRALQPDIEAAAWQLFFLSRDSTDLRDLLQLLNDFPSLTDRIDPLLSQAVKREPGITFIEKQLEHIPKTAIPQTVAALYPFYTLSGDLEDLLAFNGRYPEYIDAFNLKEEFTIARQAPDFSRPYEDSQRDAYFDYIRSAAPRYRAFQALQILISNDVLQGHWEEALNLTESLQPRFGEDDPRIKELLRILRAPAPDIRPQRYSGQVNSPLSEYAPVISADEQFLFFCRRGDRKEDIYVAGRQNDQWKEAEPLNALNSRENEAPLALSADGTTLLLFDNGAVKMSNKTRDGWGKPTPFFPEDEASFWQGGTTLSADRQVAIFAARRDDAVGLYYDGNIDLYVTFRQSDGSWSEPVNLGPAVNTPFEDRAPFLHPDNKTLYFSSNGHGGFGNLDVFKITRTGNSWTEWSAPVNLGKVFNDPGKNWGYKVSTNGAYAYFATETENGDSDLFRIDLPAELQPERVFTIAGRLTGIDGQPVTAEILLEDLTTGRPVGAFKPDPASGQFFMTLPAGRLYSYVVTGKNYFPVANNIDLRKPITQNTLQTTITVPRIEEMTERDIALPLNNLFFETDRYEIRPESFPELNRLADLAQTYDLQVDLSGHTDYVGDEEYNLTLSQNRADAVREYLIRQGCNPQQLQARGYGMSRPVAPNDTEEGRQQNRRVEVRLKAGEGD